MNRLQVGVSTLFSFLVLSCGGSEIESNTKQEIEFTRHALACAKAGLQVKLQTFDQEDCFLELTSRNTVQGTCDGFVAEQTHQLRLVYFARLPAPAEPANLELATAVSFLDLTGFSGQETVVTFDKIDQYPDDDNDGSPNIAEWCSGTNPRGD